MNGIRARLRLLGRDESGQVLPALAMMLVLVLVPMVALGIDLGHAMYSSRELQATTDSAALAGAQAMLRSSTTAQVVGSNGVGGVVGTYSAATGGWNARSVLPSVTEHAVLLCLNSLEALGQPCIGTIPYNAVQVTQTSILPMFFGAILGKPTVTLKAVSTASARGGSPRPSNVAIIVDTTLSADQVDSNCLNSAGVAQTEMQCELNGVQILLQALQPCGINQAGCQSNGVTVNPFDTVSLFTFPEVTTATASINTSCTTNPPAQSHTNNYWDSLRDAPVGQFTTDFSFPMPLGPPSYGYPTTPTVVAFPGRATAAAYSFPAVGATSYAPQTTYYSTTPPSATQVTGQGTYQVTGFLSDYRTSDSATSLNPNSILVAAAGGKAGCGGLAPPNFDGVYGTYYAGVIYAAQAALTAQQALYPSAENIMIIVSDGNATAPGYQWDGVIPVMPSSGISNPATANGSYPSWNQQCSQAVTAAQYATANGTTVYTVAYGSEPVGCTTDLAPLISPCDTMAAMASAPQEFYSDYQQSGSASTCVASQPVISLNAIFASIAADLSEARLIPNNTT